MFRLISLTLKDNPIFGINEIKFDFVNNDSNTQELNDSFYTSIIIGANGTGKSNLFSLVIEIFKELYDFKMGEKKSNRIKGYYNLKYKINKDLFSVYTFIEDDIVDDKLLSGYLKNNYIAVKLNDNNSFVKVEELQIPDHIIASSVMISDKYPQHFNYFPNYKYLGIRDASRNANSNSLTRLTVERIVEVMGDAEKATDFYELLFRSIQFLDLDGNFTIGYRSTSGRKYFNYSLNKEVLLSSFKNDEKRVNEGKRPSFRYSNYLKIKDNNELLDNLISFIKDRLEDLNIKRKEARYSSTYFLEFKLLSNKNNAVNIKDDYLKIEWLRKLGIISSPELYFEKNNRYNFSDASSGEINFFSSIISLLATIPKNKNCLIFIDEPEISLHPNWQMKYLDFLRSVFKGSDYAGCQFMIATHSHFLISDLHSENSSIIGLKRNNQGITVLNNLGGNNGTFGWSAEEVLYSVFNVRTVRNYFLEQDLTNLLGLIGQNSKDKKEIKRLIDRIEQIPVTKNDPLGEIIVEAKNYLNNND